MSRAVLPWTPILLLLVGTGVATWLVLARGWGLWQAYLLMAAALGGFALVLSVVLLLLVPESLAGSLYGGDQDDPGRLAWPSGPPMATLTLSGGHDAKFHVQPTVIMFGCDRQ